MYFTVKDQYGSALREPGVVHKFSRIPAGRIWEGGHISVFNLEDRP